MTSATPTRRSRTARPSRRRTAARVVAPGVVAALAASLAVAGGSAGPASAAARAPQGLTALACQPWQTAVTVPPGTVLTPRVFPTAEPPAARPPTTKPVAKPGNKPGAKPAPRPRVVCRNAAPTPFAQPAWDPDTVVGGPRLASKGVVVDAEPGTPMPPAVYDVSYVVADLTTGEVLAAKSAHAWLRPASTLKTLTALTLLPLLDPHQVVVASPDAQAAAGTRVGILAGNRYPVANLVDAMLMFSANDAVYALADAAGGYDHTVELMNARAREVGAFDTLVVDPSGLDDGDQRSSAYDLAVIARDAMRLPEFRTAVVKRDAVFPGGRDAKGKVWKPFHVYNINDLLRHYPGAIGVKPGRTDRAQHTFIGAATRGGRTLLVAQMGSVTGSWKPTAALLDWGFANAHRVTPVGRLVDPGEAAPPVAAPALTPLPSATAGAGSSAGRTPGASGSTGTPVAGSTVTASDPGSLAVLAGVGLLVTAGVVGVGASVRRRRRARL
ncbi:D-alanyl-D-alanine carboxypeptidase family protein [Intrasporangium sp. YIM S08009]|uniref:D-alanyl-D-alanine carboxypeptidase family protein n=1 Tax=Intrasporangium zincisolvens TaxID=3080018 RepID=UPI002B055BD5|nr:serine hydrolase [Intrasporangium sp. YIM S08009]